MQTRNACTGLGLATLIASYACGEAQTNGGELTIPDAPTITTPAAGTGIFTPVIVEGKTSDDATITVTVFADGSEVGSGSGMAQSSGGAFSVVAIITETAPGTDLVVRVVASNEAGTSEPTEVAVHQRVPDPIVATPAADAWIASPLHIHGSGLAGATVDVTVTDATGTLGTASQPLTTATISVDVPYTEPSGDELMTVSVTQSVNGHASGTIDRVVRQSNVPRPSVSAPEADRQIASPFTVSGAAESEAPVTVVVWDPSGERGRSETTADSTGEFALEVAYTEPGSGTPLSVYVYQTIGGIDSPATIRDVFQVVPPPIPTTPASGAQMSSAINVTGTGVPTATVDVVVTAASAQIGAGSGSVPASGLFDFDVTYTEPAPGTPIDVTLTQSVGAATSTAVTIAARQQVGPPTINAPVADAEIDSPLTVSGAAIALADVEVTITDEAGGLLGTDSTTANDTGVFSLSVSYTLPASQATVIVAVTQTVDGVTSAPATVATVQVLRYFTLDGSISQNGGNAGGTAVYVRLYASEAEEVDFSFEQTLTATESESLPVTPFSLSVPTGTYVLRAFRDVTGPGGPADGHPTLGSGRDPQVPATAVTVAGPTDVGNVVLRDAASSDWFTDLNVYTAHESAAPEAPEYWTGDDWEVGTGLCRGYYLFMEAHLNGDTTELTPPMVQRPDGSDTPLYDDGGCSEAVHDNSSSSFDGSVDDGWFSAGSFDPTGADAGSYYLHYRSTADDFIHVEEDLVSEIRKLTRSVPLTSHDGTAHLTTREPVLEWAPVTGANAYHIDLGWSVSGFGDDTSSTSYTVLASHNLPDDAAVRVRVDPRWFDGDLEARASAVENLLVIDTDGNDVMTVTGTLTNDTGTVAPYLVHATGDWDLNPEWNASVFLAGSATTYSLEILEDTGCNDRGAVRVVLDVDGSGDPRSPGNRTFEKELDFSGCGADPGLDFIFRPPVLLLAPDDEATTDDTPAFAWEDYATTWSNAGTSGNLPASWSYLFWAGYGMSGGGGMPQIIWGLPATATGFDMESPPADKFDVLDLATSGATANETDLSSGTSWMWNIVVVECPYGSSPDYENCVMALLSGEPDFFAQGRERELTVN